MATGYRKQLWHSRAVRPGDSDAPAKPQAVVSKARTAAPVGQLGSASAPHKTDLDRFQSKFGFGRTGMSGRS